MANKIKFYFKDDRFNHFRTQKIKKKSCASYVKHAVQQPVRLQSASEISYIRTCNYNSISTSFLDSADFVSATSTRFVMLQVQFGGGGGTMNSAPALTINVQSEKQ